jgi:hypothetical protein
MRRRALRLAAREPVRVVVVVVEVVVLLFVFCAKTRLPKLITKISAMTIPSLFFIFLLLAGISLFG